MLATTGLWSPAVAREGDLVVDVVIYGGTSAGVAAAIQAARMERSAVVVEPSMRLGGLTSGGLGQTDIGNKGVIGGISREFYQRVRRHYDNPKVWKWEQREAYRDDGQTRTAVGEDAMWTFEPSAALKVYEDWIHELDIPVIYGERLDLDNGVTKEGSRMVSIRMESGRTFQGRMFIDATYEGDLMAQAGVRYTVGREANSVYGETLNGVQTRQARHHQLKSGVDPYVRKGDPGSGLLPGIDATGPGAEGDGDHRVQAYCFRMCLTDHPENRIPFWKPEGYRELHYELLLRNFEAGETGLPWINSPMPNRKTDTNNRNGFSTDFIGENYDYPEADYPTRERILERHRLYQQGLVWTLATHPRVPEPIRREAARWGMSKDEFVEGRGWQDQLYIREARRLVGPCVMTQHHCQGREKVPDPVGMAAYTMDSHNVQRYVDTNGRARNEGDVQVGGFPPYPISYRSIVPKQSQCENLLVPVCLSASHIAFGSIRMEPVFMVLGQSAATAAAQAIEEETAVQEIDYPRLKARLLQDEQVLAYEAPRSPAGLDRRRLGGIVVDDRDATVERDGFEMRSRSVGNFLGDDYCHDGNLDKGGQSIRFRTIIPEGGSYEVRLIYSAHPNRASNVPVTIRHAGGETKVKVNQRVQPAIDGTFIALGTFRFEPGGEAGVAIANEGTDGYVIADAVQWLPTTSSDWVTVIPEKTDALLPNPGMGWQTFHRTQTDDPNLPDWIPSTVHYARWGWGILEPEPGKIDEAFLDQVLQETRAAGQRLAFRVMCCSTSPGRPYHPSWLGDVGGNVLVVDYGDQRNLPVPDLDNAVVLARHLDFIARLGARYDGHPDIDHVDLGTVGWWGEWHMSSSEAGRMPSPEHQKQIIDAYLAAFRRTSVLMLIGGRDSLTYAAERGAGWRADCLGDMGGFSENWCHMRQAYPILVPEGGVQETWRQAPIAWESCWDMRRWVQEEWPLRFIFNYALALHGSYLNNKSAPLPEGEDVRYEIERFLRRLGYRLALQELSHPRISRSGTPFEVKMRWQNTGSAPCYRPYRIAYRLSDGSGSPVVLVGGVTVEKWMPGSIPIFTEEFLRGPADLPLGDSVDVADQVMLPDRLAAGLYELAIGVVGETTDEPIIRLAIQGRAQDGWYPLSKLEVTE